MLLEKLLLSWLNSASVTIPPIDPGSGFESHERRQIIPHPFTSKAFRGDRKCPGSTTSPCLHAERTWPHPAPRAPPATCKHLPSAHHASGTVMGAGDRAANQTGQGQPSCSYEPGGQRAQLPTPGPAHRVTPQNCQANAARRAFCKCIHRMVPRYLLQTMQSQGMLPKGARGT